MSGFGDDWFEGKPDAGRSDDAPARPRPTFGFVSAGDDRDHQADSAVQESLPIEALTQGELDAELEREVAALISQLESLEAQEDAFGFEELQALRRIHEDGVQHADDLDLEAARRLLDDASVRELDPMPTADAEAPHAGLPPRGPTEDFAHEDAETTRARRDADTEREDPDTTARVRPSRRKSVPTAKKPDAPEPLLPQLSARARLSERQRQGHLEIRIDQQTDVETTITLLKVPDGVTFSAGAETGPHRWTMLARETSDLQFRVPAHVPLPFHLGIVACRRAGGRQRIATSVVTVHRRG